MYLILTGILPISYFLKCLSKELGEKIYKILFGLLWLILALRYGQGTDFFAYQYIFERCNSFDGVIANRYQLHSEIGFRFICFLFQGNYALFIFCISTFEMIMLKRFLDRYSQDKLLSLALFFPTFYLTYYFSALREGLVISLFIGVILETIEKKEWKKFVVFTIIAMLIHSVAVVLFVIPFWIKIEIKDSYVIIAFSLIIGFILSTGIFNQMLISIPIVGEGLRSYL